ncbi:MAG TPA: hypothetical protein VGC45_05805 [Gryllotalpicola sp.]
MRARLSIVTALALAGVVLSCAGCTTTGARSGVVIPVNAVYLDASPWLSAHPDAVLNACYGKHCQSFDAIQRGSVQLWASGKPCSAHRLTITS